MVNYPKLTKFFTYDTQIHGTKVSFDRDVFKEISPKEKLQFKYLKDITKNDKHYRRLSKSQKQITDLINDFDKNVDKIKDNYLLVCRDKIKDRYGDLNYDFKIIKYKNYKTKSENKVNQLLNKDKYPYGKNKGKSIKNLDKSFIQKLVKSDHYLNNKKLRSKIMKHHKKTIHSLRKNSNKSKTKKGGRKKKRTKKRNLSKQKYICYTGVGAKKNGNHTEKEFLKRIKKKKFQFKKNEKPQNINQWIDYVGAYKGKCKASLYYFWMEGCRYCTDFNKIWDDLSNKYNDKLFMEKYEMNEANKFGMLKKYSIKSYPTIILIKDGIPIKFNKDRNIENIHNFLKKNNAF